MKLQFMFLGKKTPLDLQNMTTKYVDRLRKYVKVELCFLNEKSATKLEQRIFTKNQLNSYFVILDEKGRQVNSIQYANLINEIMLNSSNIVFLIGESYGFPQEIVNRVSCKISLSNMTFPHMIARLLILEQTYRAYSILNHHPYHHE